MSGFLGFFLIYSLTGYITLDMMRATLGEHGGSLDMEWWIEAIIALSMVVVDVWWLLDLTTTYEDYISNKEWKCLSRR